MDSLTPAVVRAKRVASLVKHASLHVYGIEGQYDGSPMRLLVADNAAEMRYIRNLAFPDGSTITRAGTVPSVMAARLATADADIVVVGVNVLMRKLFSSAGFHLVPRWVRLFLPTREEPYERIYEKGRQSRKYFKWMLKKIKDEGFSCETTNDPNWLKGFYDNMYRPYAEQRYGELAIVHNFEKIRESFSNGAGIIVKRQGEPVAGAVISFIRDIVRIPHFGAVGGDMGIIRDGAGFAMDYYVAQMAHRNGYAYVDFGHSRPFLSDGPLRYKMNWHMEVRDHANPVGLFAIAAPGKTEQAVKFLAENRFFELRNGGVRLCDEYRHDDADSG